MNKESINKRFIVAVNYLLSSRIVSGKGAISDSLDIKPSKFSEILNSRMNVGADLIATLSDLYNIDANWLLNGRGSMLKNRAEFSPEETYSDPVHGVGYVPPTAPIEAQTHEKPEVNYERKGAPYYNVDFIGGFDLVYNNQTLNPDYYIDFEPYNKPGVVWCNITGHSMEPELNNGDFIAMKEMKSPIQYLPAGEIYGIVTEDYRTVKRMTTSDKDGFVRLIPTNKSPEFKPQDIPVSMICKVFAVLGLSLIHI